MVYILTNTALCIYFELGGCSLELISRLVAKNQGTQALEVQ